MTNLITPNSCRSCVHHWHATPKEHFCRRYPPHPTPVIVPSNQPPGFAIATTISTYPPIETGWSCGEYKRGILQHEAADNLQGDN